MSYLIKGGLRAYSFITNAMSANQDTKPFSDRLASLGCDIPFFLGGYYDHAPKETNPLSFLQQRYIVTLIGHRKAKTQFQHESLIVWVRDMIEGDEYNFVVERIPSTFSLDANFALFTTSPESKKVLEII